MSPQGNQIRTLLYVPGKMQRGHILNELEREDLFCVYEKTSFEEVVAALLHQSNFHYLLISSTLHEGKVVDLIDKLRQEPEILRRNRYLQVVVFSSKTKTKRDLFPLQPFFVLPQFSRGELSRLMMEELFPITPTKNFMEAFSRMSSFATDLVDRGESPLLILPSAIIVDDQTINRIVLSKMLKKMNIESAQVEGRSKLLNLLDEYREKRQFPKIILLDQELGEDTGTRILAELKGSYSELVQNTVFVAVTGHSDEDKLDEIKNAGFQEIFGKPVNLPKMRSFLEKKGLLSV